MHRRRFLSRGALAALSLSGLSIAGCSRLRPKAIGTKTAAPWRRLAADLESRIPRLMADTKVPGLSIAVVDGNRIVWRRGFGFADAAAKRPVDNDTVFQAASMSKPVFAYVALKFCEDGIIGLDRSLAPYAPEPFLKGDPQINLITPRHVLSHSSGFQNWRSKSAPLKIHFTPGSQYMYSGEGYYYLQSAITHLQGKVNRNDCAQFEADLEVCASDISKLMAARILNPFRMNSSGYEWNDWIERHHATGHDENGNPLPKPKPTGPSIARYAAAGALLTTPSDYARFMMEILSPRRPDEYRLSQETVTQMLRPHVKVIDGPYTSSWGLGWQIQDNGLINHGGDNAGFHCHAIASPKARSGFVVMTNGDKGPVIIQQLFVLNALDPFFGT